MDMDKAERIEKRQALISVMAGLICGTKTNREAADYLIEHNKKDVPESLMSTLMAISSQDDSL